MTPLRTFGFAVLLWIAGTLAAPGVRAAPTVDDCMDCHGDAGIEMTLPDGGTKSLFVDGKVYRRSVHGKGACTTCHVIVREGFDSLEEADELEEDYLDKAWGLEQESRLSCQAQVGETNLVVEIPRYTINHASERH